MKRSINGMICMYDHQHYLMIVEHKHGMWCIEFPGGKVDEGETNLDAAKREFREETEANISESELRVLPDAHGIWGADGRLLMWRRTMYLAPFNFKPRLRHLQRLRHNVYRTRNPNNPTRWLVLLTESELRQLVSAYLLTVDLGDAVITLCLRWSPHMYAPPARLGN